MIYFTDLEKQVIGAFDVAFNYDDAESEKSDNATAINARDIDKKTGMGINVAKGVMGSLVKKGLLQEFGDDLPDNCSITDAGIDAYYLLQQVSA